MPEEGGYYIWVRDSLGPFWAVQEARWTMSYSVMLLACFPVLFVSYLSYLVPWIAPSADVPGTHSGMLVRWIVALLVIVSAMTVNLRGTRDVGRSAIIAAAFVVGTFLIVLRIRRPNAHRPFRVPGGTWGLACIFLAPLIVAVTVLVATVRNGDSYGPQLLLIAVSVLSGIALYLTRRRQVEAKRPTSIT